jgi:hypothetical protein
MAREMRIPVHRLPGGHQPGSKIIKTLDEYAGVRLSGRHEVLFNA